MLGEVLIGGMASLLICMFLGPRFIEFLRLKEFGQHIRAEGPAGHHGKAGTPTMGGLAVFLAVCVPFLIVSEYLDFPDTLDLRVVKTQVDLGLAYPILIFLVLAGSTNGVNLTDGLDGLAAGCAAIVFLTFTAMTFITGDSGVQRDLALLCACLVGACVGFLWFNSFPASVFMGDTGSLGLGGAIAGLAVIT